MTKTQPIQKGNYQALLEADKAGDVVANQDILKINGQKYLYLGFSKFGKNGEGKEYKQLFGDPIPYFEPVSNNGNSVRAFYLSSFNWKKVSASVN